MFVENTSTGALTFVSSFTANTLGVTGLSNSATLYFAGGSTQTITGNLILNGSAGNFVVIRSTNSSLRSHLTLTSVNMMINYADVRDNDASGGTQLVAFNSIDAGNNV